MVAPPTTPPVEPEPEPKEELPPAPLVEKKPASPTSLKKLPSSDSGEDSSKENKENGNMDKAQLRAAARRKGQLGVFFSPFYVVHVHLLPLFPFLSSSSLFPTCFCRINSFQLILRVKAACFHLTIKVPLHARVLTLICACPIFKAIFSHYNFSNVNLRNF